MPKVSPAAAAPAPPSRLTYPCRAMSKLWLFEHRSAASKWVSPRPQCGQASRSTTSPSTWSVSQLTRRVFDAALAPLAAPGRLCAAVAYSSRKDVAPLRKRTSFARLTLVRYGSGRVVRVSVSYFALTKVGDRESDGHCNHYRGTHAQFPDRGGYAVELVLGVVAGGRAQNRLDSPP